MQLLSFFWRKGKKKKKDRLNYYIQNSTVVNYLQDTLNPSSSLSGKKKGDICPLLCPPSSQVTKKSFHLNRPVQDTFWNQMPFLSWALVHAWIQVHKGGKYHFKGVQDMKSTVFLQLINPNCSSHLARLHCTRPSRLAPSFQVFNFK